MPVGMRAPAAENRVRAVLVGRRKCDTQLHAIRDLMLSAAQRGAWMTLSEIAGLTEIGEASISAQLRHLRKARHGRHRVEKRRRTSAAHSGGLAAWDGNPADRPGVAATERLAEDSSYHEPPHAFRKTESVRHPPGDVARLVERRAGGAAIIWEYRVLPPAR